MLVVTNVTKSRTPTDHQNYTTLLFVNIFVCRWLEPDSCANCNSNIASNMHNIIIIIIAKKQENEIKMVKSEPSLQINIVNIVNNTSAHEPICEGTSTRTHKHIYIHTHTHIHFGVLASIPNIHITNWPSRSDRLWSSEWCVIMGESIVFNGHLRNQS